MKLDRRKLLVALAALTFGASLLACNRKAAANQDPGQWKVKIVSEQESGEPLIVSGTIYSPDGKKPLPGITLYVYQTDVTGRYSTSGGDNRGTRIHGVMKTNAEGRYEFRTIKPGSYPNSRNPAHIHAYVSGPDFPSIGSTSICSRTILSLRTRTNRRPAVREVFRIFSA